MGQIKISVSLIFPLLLCLGSLFFPSQVSATPTPDLSVNDGHYRVLLMPDRLLDVVIEMDPAERAGAKADWWLFAKLVATSTYFYFDPVDGWLPGYKVSYQGPLDALPSYTALAARGLPAGTYEITFGVDMLMNGRMSNEAYLDRVEIMVPQYECPDTLNSQDALSQVQKSFIASRGTPELFFSSFVSEDYDVDTHKTTYLSTIRRLDNWVYNRDKLTMASFDGGFFVEEKEISAPMVITATQLSPANFSACMDLSDVKTLMGEPSCIRKEVMATNTYSYAYYNASATVPASTLIFENNLLISVIAGYAIDYQSDSDNNPCTFD